MPVLTSPVVLLCKWQPALAEALLERTSELYVIFDEFDTKHFDPAAKPILDRVERCYHISTFDSIEELASVTTDLRLRGVTVDRVVSHSEFSQFGAGYLEMLLIGKDDPDRHVSFRDKRLMKAQLSEAGVPTARFASIPFPPDPSDVVRVAGELAFPVVVKPATGFGTMSTHRVDSPADLEPAVSGLCYEPELRSRQLIVEEFVDGREVVVDAIWSDGEPLSFLVHAYHQTRLDTAAQSSEETVDFDGMRVPPGLDGSYVLTESNHPELHKRLHVLHAEVNDVLGIRTGFTHLEAFVRPDGELVFSEIATRIGGGWCARLITAHLSREVWQSFADVVTTGTCPPPAPAHPYLGAIHMRPSRPGVITSIPSDAEIAACPGVVTSRKLREVGDKANLSHPSEWYLFLIIGADSAAEFEQARTEVARRLAIEVDEAS